MQGILDEYFYNLEFLEDTKPNFVENIIGTYFSSSAAYMDELEQILDTKPLDLGNVERLIHKLKGGSASMGAAKLHAIVGEMLDVFKAKRFDGLYAAFEKIKVEHASLKMHLEPYAELLRQLRMDYPPDEASDNHEDAESIDSNDIND
ncbi:pseudo histidine-containing phosphotransfer protein 2-like [Beta vulgaris subsp. vulgaris]|uniref:pseudo histidine-containing phosphotransfer protein 2-like n=1 Tax=Beta vulgaris subsp. vulgaris TaxID=3555 RepID=UPI002036CB9F|nr:pseudo histidine-containing phosphotransfer protein 2-like [Beta vulgaris subsp. vulgaris]